VSTGSTVEQQQWEVGNDNLASKTQMRLPDTSKCQASIAIVRAGRRGRITSRWHWFGHTAPAVTRKTLHDAKLHPRIVLNCLWTV